MQGILSTKILIRKKGLRLEKTLTNSNPQDRIRWLPTRLRITLSSSNSRIGKITNLETAAKWAKFWISPKPSTQIFRGISEMGASKLRATWIWSTRRTAIWICRSRSSRTRIQTGLTIYSGLFLLKIREIKNTRNLRKLSLTSRNIWRKRRRPSKLRRVWNWQLSMKRSWRETKICSNLKNIGSSTLGNRVMELSKTLASIMQRTWTKHTLISSIGTARMVSRGHLSLKTTTKLTIITSHRDSFKPSSL
jgi:hypothetical protein